MSFLWDKLAGKGKTPATVRRHWAALEANAGERSASSIGLSPTPSPEPKPRA